MLEARGSADNRHTPYQPFIDGLRAIAVLSVIAFHISGKILPGGYLGVDIFFVISGYLITNVIWREAINHKFSVVRFYERRVRRIMPALVALLLIVTLCSIVILLPIDLVGFAKSVFASVGFVANIYFWRDTDYFSRLADEKPLLHLWSLGVEEQFYIFYPLIAVACVRWRKASLLPITLGIVILSLILNIVAIRIGGSSPAFYLLPTRAWEIGAGSILALIPIAATTRKKWHNLLAVVAAISIAVGLFLERTPLAGSGIPAAIWVVLGTALTIYLGNLDGAWFTDLLSSGVLVGIGLISYSLYLWHWPLLVFARYYLVESKLSATEAIMLLGLMLIVSTLSWRVVERPFRERAVSIRKVLVWVGSGCCLVALAAGVILANRGFPSRYPVEIAHINAAVGSEYRCSVGQMFPFGGSRACLLGAQGADPDEASVALVGNSHAQMYAPLISQILQENKLKGILVPLNGCLPIPDYNESQICMQQAYRDFAAVVALPHVRIVILAMTWNFSEPMYTPEGSVPEGKQLKTFCDSLDRVISRYRSAGKSVVLIGPLALPGYDIASVVARQMAFGRPITGPLYMPEGVFWTKYGETISHYESRRDIIFVRPDRAQCQKGRCEYFNHGSSLFADDNHLAQESLSFFRPVFESALHSAL